MAAALSSSSLSPSHSFLSAVQQVSRCKEGSRIMMTKLGLFRNEHEISCSQLTIWHDICAECKYLDFGQHRTWYIGLLRIFIPKNHQN